VFWKWIFYGSVQALIIFACCYIGYGKSINFDGSYGDLTINGAVTYAGVVVIANMKIITSTNSYTWVSFLIVFLSILTYFLNWALESGFSIFTLFGTFSISFRFTVFYISMAFIIMFLIILDTWFYWREVLQREKEEAQKNLERLKR
jgi:hypothetical protein